MTIWHPSSAQWRVIWIVYAISFLITVDWDRRVPMKAGTFIVFVPIAGGLVIWRMQGKRDRETTEADGDQ